MNGDFPDPASNEILAKLLSHGDIDAFDQIYNRFWFPLFNVSYGILRDSAICEDIVQDIFVSLWKNRKTSGIADLERYLFRSIKLKVFQYLRNGKLAQGHLEKIKVISFMNETESRVNFQEVEEYLTKGMEKLPPKCREVFYLSRFENKSNREIANQLSVSVKTVEGHITYALKYLQRYLKEFITQ